MQNQEQEKTSQGQLQEKLDILAKFTPESLVRTRDLGRALDFSDGVEHFKRTLNLFSKLKGVNLDDFPDQRLQNLITLASEAIITFENIKKFESTQPNAVQARNNLIQQVKTQYTNQFNQIEQVLAYTFSQGTDFENLVGEAKAAVSRVEEEGKKVETASKQIDDILKEARKAAAKIGVAKYAVIFKTEADSHKRKARWWLVATGVLAVLTVVFGFWIVSYYADKVAEMSIAQTIQFGISKLIILAVLYFGIVWSGRIYKAQQHNYVVNQHRHNALNTFETFVKATEDEQTKNAVLIQATQSIFSPQHSGFTAHEKELITSPQASEIFKIFMGGGK